MKRSIIAVCLILIVGHSQTELATALHKKYKAYMNEKVNLFINYDMSMERLWYIKMTGDDILYVMTFVAMAIISHRYSFKLFVVSMIFLGYHVFDGFMFWYNYRTGYALYYSLDVTICLSILILLLPIERWRSKYKSLV